MMHGDTMRQPGGMMPGIVTGVPKRTMRPIVDGIVSGLPRNPKPSVATPTQTPDGHSATKIPHAAFGSGMFGEGAGPRTAEKKNGKAKEGTTKGEERKTARRAYE